MSRYSNEPFDFGDHSRIQEFLTENFISTTAKWKLQEFCGINCPGSLRSPIVFSFSLPSDPCNNFPQVSSPSSLSPAPLHTH